MFARPTALLSFALLVASGCASEAGSPDAGTRGDAEARDAELTSIELGTGAERFETLEDGQGIELQRGPQGGDPLGGFHIWVGLRAHGLDPRELDVTLSITSTSGAERSRGQFRVNLEASPDGDVTYGLRAVLSNCCLTEQRDLVMRLDATDGAGRTASDEVRLHALDCPRGLPNPTIDPCP